MINMNQQKLLEEYQAFIEPHLSSSSVIAYVRDASRYIETMGDKLLTATQSDIEEFLADLASQMNDNGEVKYKPASINRQRASIVSLYNFLMDNSMVAHNPASGIKGINYKECRKEKIDNYLTPMEVAQLIDGIETNTEINPFNKKRDILMCNLMVWTGIKINELSRLKINQFNTDTMEIEIIDVNDNSRFLPITPLLVSNFNSYMEERQKLVGNEDNDYIFLSERKAPLSLQLTNHTLNKHRTHAGLEKKVNNTTLRNTYAMKMFNSGMGVEELSRLLGHTTINFTSTFYSEYISRQKGQ